MRGSLLIARVASAVGLGVMLSPVSVTAATAEYLEKCGVGGPMRANAWSPFDDASWGDSRKPILPVDAHPWFFAECGDPEQAFDCVLEHESRQELVLVTAEGLKEACDDPFQRAHPIRLVPAEPLRPSSRYTVRCASNPLVTDFIDVIEQGESEGPSLAIGGSTSSLPPTDLKGTKAELIRRDDTCCGDDPLHLVVTPPQIDETDAFAREGGVIEVLHEGDVWYLRPGGGELPWTEEGITVTAIAADGTRGEALEIPAEAIPEELVLNNFDCALGRRLSDSALWLLMPLVFLRWSRRRARRREDRRCRR